MKTFARRKTSSTVLHVCFLEGFAASYYSQWGIQVRLLTSHLYRQNQQVHRVQRGGWTVALPWPPGSKSEPSCSQRSQGPSPSELLLLMPDLTPSQLSFVLLGVGADLTHSWGPGSSVRAFTPQGPACHMVTALLRDQDKVLLLAPVFPVGYVQASFVITLGNMMLPLGPERGFQRGARGQPVGWFCCLWQLLLFWILLSPSSSSPRTDTGARFDLLG